MDSNKVFQIMGILRDKITPEQSYYVSETLKKTDDKAFSEIFILPFKNIIATILLGLFLGYYGVNRFYVGDKIMGAVKLSIGVFLTAANIIISVLVNNNILVSAYAIQAVKIIDLVLTIVLVAYFIYNIVDIFMSVKYAKSANFKMIMEALAKHPQTANVNDGVEIFSELKSNDAENIFPDVLK